MHEQNIALLGKLSWDLIPNSSKLWASILQAKYLRGNGLRYSIVSPSVSYVWKSILKGFHKLKDEKVWLIGNRKDVSIWLDKWCMDVVLIQMVPELRDSDAHLLVADLILEMGSLVCFGLLFLIFVRAWIIWFGILLLMGSFLLNLPTIIGFFITPVSLLQLLIILGCGNLEFLKRWSILCNSFVMIDCWVVTFVSVGILRGFWYLLSLSSCQETRAPHTPRLFLS